MATPEIASRSARLGSRIAPDTLDLARQAARLEGRSLSDFVAGAVLEAARRTIEEAHLVRLTVDGQRRFADLLANPPEPTDGLRRAFEHRDRLLGRS